MGNNMNYFFDRFEQYGSQTAFLQDDGSTMSYEEIDAYAAWMHSVIPTRTLMFCLCENSIGSAAGYLACLHNRIVPLLLDAGINLQLLGDLIRLYQPGWLYVPEQLAESEEFQQVFFGIQEKGMSDAAGAEEGTLQDDAEAFCGSSAGGRGYKLIKTGYTELVPMDDTLGLLLTTSGSTGSPKLVRQSYDNIQANTDSIVSYLEIDEEERPVTTLPMYYTYGLSVINSHVHAGACVLLTEHSIITRAFWDFMKENRATSIAGVPYTYEMLKRARFFRMELPDLHTMTQAGGKLLPELHREFAEYAAENGKKFVVMYGQTEATARMGYLPAGKALDKVGSMGIPIPGGRFALIDVNGDEISVPEKTGELIYEGANVTLGYAECREDLAKGDERHGRLETGDMAQFDTDGYYYIVGRKKRFLKLFGSRVNLDEVERMIRPEFPDIDCACSGEDDVLKVFITDPHFSGEVERFLISRTHINQRAIRVIPIREIPRSESGKVLYKELPQR